MKCILCREDKKPYRFMLSTFSEYDEVTGEKISICEECALKMKNRKAGWGYFAGRGIRKAIHYWYDNGFLTPEELEKIHRDYAKEAAIRYLNTSSPSFIIVIGEDKYVVVDERTRRVLFNNKVVDFSDIEGYQIFDNSVECQTQTSNSTQYNIATDKGLRRTIVGGILAGTAGAVMGGLTANHSMVVNEGPRSTINSIEHKFSILVSLKSFQHGGSVAVQIGQDEVKMQMIANVIEKIMR